MNYMRTNGTIPLDLEKIVREEWAAVLCGSELVINEDDGWKEYDEWENKKWKQMKQNKYIRKHGEQISMFDIEGF